MSSTSLSSPEQPPGTATADGPRISTRRVIFGAGVGNALEWYD
ncbi:hypothetical protein ACFV8T_43925 [Streptomyces sp. NPDC059832]